MELCRCENGVNGGRGDNTKETRSSARYGSSTGVSRGIISNMAFRSLRERFASVAGAAGKRKYCLFDNNCAVVHKYIINACYGSRTGGYAITSRTVWNRIPNHVRRPKIIVMSERPLYYR